MNRPPPRQCTNSTNLGRCRRLAVHTNGLCAECERLRAAGDFVVLDSYLPGGSRHVPT